jgi:hypothetical protein
MYTRDLKSVSHSPPLPTGIRCNRVLAACYAKTDVGVKKGD